MFKKLLIAGISNELDSSEVIVIEFSLEDTKIVARMEIYGVGLWGRSVMR